MDEETTISSASDGAAPVEPASLSRDEGASAIEKILTGNAPAKADHVEEGEAQTSNGVVDDDDQPLVIDDENDDGADDTAHAPAKPQAVDHEAMVALPDGKQISVGELVRNNMFHRDYTFKLDGLKKQANDFVAWQNSEVERITQLNAQALAFAKKHMPQPPDRSLADPKNPNYDPFTYNEQKLQYEIAMEEINAVQEQNQAQEQAFQERYEADMAKTRVEQLEAFYLGAPKLRDKAQREAFFQDVRTIVPAAYRLNPEELLALENSGAMLMLYDAIRYRKALADGRKVAQELPGKPKLEGRQRSSPATEQARDMQGRFKALRENNGSFDAAQKAIEAILSR